MSSFQTLPTDIILLIYKNIPESYPMLRKVNRRLREVLANQVVDIVYCMDHAAARGYKIHLGDISNDELYKYVTGGWYNIVLHANYTWSPAEHLDVNFLRRMYIECSFTNARTRTRTDTYVHNDSRTGENGSDDFIDEDIDNFAVGRANADAHDHDKRNFLENLFVHIISRYTMYDDHNISAMIIMMDIDHIIKQSHYLGIKFDDYNLMYYAYNVKLMRALRSIGCPWPGDMMKTVTFCLMRGATNVHRCEEMLKFMIEDGYNITNDDFILFMENKRTNIIRWVGESGFRIAGSNLPRLTLSPEMKRLVRVCAPDY